MRWLALLLLLAVGGPVSGPRVKTTRRQIEALGMDGPIVAYDLSARYDPGCNRLYAWNVNTNGGAVVSGKATCEADDSSTGAGVTEIAVAGKRIAWIVNGGGNTEMDDDLYTASLPKPKEQHLLFAMRTGDVDQGDLDGDWISGLAGDGNLIAVSSWTTSGATVSNARLRIVEPNGLKTIGRGSAAIVSTAVARGQIAIVHRDGTVGMRSAGKAEERITVATDGATDAAIAGNRLLALTRQGLEVYDTGSGRLLATSPAPARVRDLDAEGDVAVYRTAGAVYAVRISTGKRVVLARTPGGLVGLAIERPGVVYAYNTRGGHLVFRPLRRVEAVLR